MLGKERRVVLTPEGMGNFPIAYDVAALALAHDTVS